MGRFLRQNRRPKPFASTLRPSSLPRRMLSSWLCRTRGTRTRTCPVVLKRAVRGKVEVAALGRPLCPSKRCRGRRSGLGIRQLKSGGARVHVTELGRVLPAEDYLSQLSNTGRGFEEKRHFLDDVVRVSSDEGANKRERLFPGVCAVRSWWKLRNTQR